MVKYGELFCMLITVRTYRKYCGFNGWFSCTRTGISRNKQAIASWQKFRGIL